MALAFLGMSALEFLVTQADKILLGLYLNPRVVGIYVLASTLSSFIPMILQSVNQIFAPVIADLHAQGKRDVLQKLFQTLTKWVDRTHISSGVRDDCVCRPADADLRARF